MLAIENQLVLILTPKMERLHGQVVSLADYMHLEEKPHLDTD